MTYRHGALLALIGSGVVMLGSIMPWASVASGFGQMDFVGTSGDGILTLGLGALAALVVFLILAGVFRDAPAAAIALALIGVGVLSIAVPDIQNLAGKLTNGTGVRSSIGPGILLVLIGGVVTLLGGVLALKFHGRQEMPQPEPPAPAVPTPDHLATLEALAGMRDRGLITTEEFEAKKAELLARL